MYFYYLKSFGFIIVFIFIIRLHYVDYSNYPCFFLVCIEVDWTRKINLVEIKVHVSCHNANAQVMKILLHLKY